MKKIVFILLVALFLMSGCTQLPKEISCDKYCAEQLHVECVGEWIVSGQYPNCSCEYMCHEQPLDIECVGEGGTIPIIANPPECCEGLELIPPTDSNIVGISGYCIIPKKEITDKNTTSDENQSQENQEPVNGLNTVDNEQECIGEWKCKDADTKIYQDENCSLENETKCDYGCLNGECNQEPCLGITCADKCEGKVRKYEGTCVNGECQYLTQECSYDCLNGTCISDTCLGIVCPNKCENKIRKYNGTCVSGICQYDAQECSYKCQDAVCVTDPCEGISCNDYCQEGIHYFDGNCTNGICQYQNQECPWGCSGNSCKIVESFSCKYVWYQEILNAATGESLMECPSVRPYCKAGYAYCCNYDFTKEEHYNCADCQTNDCGETGECYNINCTPSYCEGSTRNYNGVCRNGNCEYETENCTYGCTDGKCIEPAKIFATSQKWQANLGGINGADAKCQAAASAAGLSGTWIAIISDSSHNAKDKLPDKIFVRIDGQIIANSKADLFDGTINVPINITETGSVIAEQYHYAWTGTNSLGNYSTPSSFGTASCDDWSKNWGGHATDGLTSATDNRWIETSTPASTSCLNSSSLYCVSLPA